MNNSIQSIYDFLDKNPFSTERDINEYVWNHFRGNPTSGSNKKYAEMLRRGLRKGTIKRKIILFQDELSKYFYYLPNK